MESSTIAIIIILITIVSFILEKIPLAMTAMLSSIAMGIILPEMSLDDVYAGFSSSTVMMVAGMCVVGDSLFQTGMADKLGAAIGASKFAKNERVFTIVVVICAGLMSSVLSNSGTIATWMPIVAAVAAKSNGIIRSKMVIMAAGIAAAIGGAGTLVGSGSQQMANTILMTHQGYEDGLTLLDETWIMIPLFIIMVIYFGTVGYSLTKKVLKPENPDFNKGNYYFELEQKLKKQPDQSTEQPDVPKWKGYLSVAVLAFCIIGFIVSSLPAFKEYLEKTLAELDWNTIIILGAAQGFATGLDVSGGGKVIADLVLNLFGGDNASPVILMAAGVIVTTVLTNFMSNSALAAMMTPIYIEIAFQMGVSPVPFVIVIGCIATNLACATPVGTPCCTQTLPAGYKYMDYVKIGGPLCIILMIATVFLGPVIYPV